MNDIKNVLICGLGAIGSIYADKISRLRECKLKILVDENRLKRYRGTPLFFNGQEIKLDYILPLEKTFKADLVIIAVKSAALGEVIDNLGNFIYEDTIILSLLNGIESENLISEKYDNVLHSFYIGNSAVRNDRNINHSGVSKIVFGSPDKKNENKVSKVKNLFEKADINYEISDDIIRSMWLKFMLNVSSNQVSAILGYDFGQICSGAKTMNLISNIMNEVQLLAQASGVNNSDTLAEEAIAAINSIAPDGKTSMLQDIEAKRKSEVEIFAGTVIKLGHKFGIPTPYNMVLKELIEAIEEKF